MKIYFNNKYYDNNNIKQIAQAYPNYSSLISFINDWRNNESTFEFQTSGSTGSPKFIKIKRNQIEASVEMTKKALGLKSTDKVLVCLNPEYIATIMMITRCLILDLDVFIIEAKSNPFEDFPEDTTIDFASFVPLQIEKIINQNGSVRLEKIRNILIGGATISKKLQYHLKSLETNIYQSYGMTETVSHIALMNLATDSNFQVLDGVEINQDHRGCIGIRGAVTDGKWLQTNDIAELINNREFLWKGRADRVINSGGVKVFPEELEQFTKDVLDEYSFGNDFFFCGLKDEYLGEKIVLIFEKKSPNQKILDTVKNRIIQRFSKYSVPRETYEIDEFIRTKSGKLAQKQTLQKILSK